MKIILTLDEVVERGLWEKVAEMQGYGLYAPQEGMPRDYEFMFYEDEAKQLGILV